ncbi:hypothetical protein Noda2021_08390 [Candidatus Dependentiae bacterium Noda2021]|nr:hypothetical protein Noda2021_08390 [Candidatus Dependentiae bacterium Noda2021]
MKIILLMLCILSQTIHAFELWPSTHKSRALTEISNATTKRLIKEAQIRKLNGFLCKSYKPDAQLKEWLRYTITQGLSNQTKSLLKSGALQIDSAQNYHYSLLRRAFLDSDLNNFKRLLLYGASYRSLLFCQDCYLNEMPISKEKASFIQALIDFGPVPYENKPHEENDIPSLKELASTKLVASVAQNKKQLVHVLRQSAYGFYPIIAKSLVNFAAHNQPLLLIKHVAYAQKKLSKRQFSYFFEGVDHGFNDLHAEKYNALHTRVNLYNLRATDFKDIYKEARALTE